MRHEINSEQQAGDNTGSQNLDPVAAQPLPAGSPVEQVEKTPPADVRSRAGMSTPGRARRRRVQTTSRLEYIRHTSTKSARMMTGLLELTLGGIGFCLTAMVIAFQVAKLTMNAVCDPQAFTSSWDGDLVGLASRASMMAAMPALLAWLFALLAKRGAAHVEAAEAMDIVWLNRKDVAELSSEQTLLRASNQDFVPERELLRGAHGSLQTPPAELLRAPHNEERTDP